MSEYDQVKEIVLGALALEGSARGAFLDEACAGQEVLRAQVESLLAHEDVSGFMSAPLDSLPEDLIESFLAEPVEASPGEPISGGREDATGGTPDQIGHYRILQHLGSGGMGDVYLAEQADPVRKVALKLIKRGMDSNEVIARFETERQALAMMDHPSVAKVFDAGCAEDGRPYFVLEYVEGLPITKHCDVHNLSIARRLELFIKVCDAVQHAHQKGIIHRDIKPSNILVAVTDTPPKPPLGKRGRGGYPLLGKGGDGGVPKVIDFGVAKAIDQRLGQRTVLTEQGQLIGTPAYMSPEQAGLTGEDIDTRADIYSLGVLLYGLLAGALPFEPTTGRRTPLDETRRGIREGEPLKPSSRVGSTVRTIQRSPGDAGPTNARGSGLSIAEIALHRGTDPGSLCKLISGDLDWITMKALEKDRTRRYANASDLAADIRRYLKHEPVLAGPPGRVYRLEKFVRRNRIGVVAGSVVALVLVAATGVSIAQRRIAEAAKRLAEQRGDHLATVVEFQSSMLSGIDTETMGRSIIDDLREGIQKRMEDQGASAAQIEATLASFNELASKVNWTDTALKQVDKTILARAVEKIEEEFSDQPLVEMELRQTIGGAYFDLGLYDQALPQLERGLALCRRELGNDHADTLTSIDAMGILLGSMGRFAKALALCREALEGRRRVLGDADPETLRSIHNMGFLLQSMGKYADALPYYREALEGRRLLGDDHGDTLATINNMGRLFAQMGRYSEALPHFREALEGTRRVLGDDHPGTLTAINNMGALLQAMGKFDEALPFYAEALEGRRRVLGDEHPVTLVSINNMGYVLWAMGKFAEALPYCREALEGNRRVLGDEHPDTSVSVATMGSTLYSMGKYTEALPYFEETLAGRRRALGDDHSDTLVAINNLGVLLRSMGRYTEAQTRGGEAMEGLRRVLGNDHPDTLHAINNMGLLFKAMGKYAAAQPYLREALEGFRKLGDEHPKTLASMNHLACNLQLRGDLEEAEKLYRKAVEGTRRTLGDRHPRLADPLVGLAEVLLKTGDTPQAHTLIQEALTIRQAALPDDHVDIAETRSVLGDCLTALGRYDEAEGLILASHDRLKAIQGESGQGTTKTLQHAVKLYEAWDAAAPGEGYADKAAEWRARLAELDQTEDQ